MVQFDYARWWQLHLRNARREPLTDKETAIYQSDLEHLDSIETSDNQDVKAVLHRLRGEIYQLEQECAARAVKKAALAQKIVELEALYHNLTGQML